MHSARGLFLVFPGAQRHGLCLPDESTRRRHEYFGVRRGRHAPRAFEVRAEHGMLVLVIVATERVLFAAPGAAPF
eukprot:IDg20189t1